MLKRGVARTFVGAAAAGLVVFHLHLLWQRLDDLSVFEPVVAAKWLLTGLLLAALWRLRARGYRLLGGRRAGVIWLLALLLHVQVPFAPGSHTTAVEVDYGWLLALPATASFGAAIALTLGLALATFARVLRPRPHRLRPSARRRGRPLARSVPVVSCRPPPLLS